jgi:hypothetical protein
MARVGDYSFGRIVVDGHEEQTDLILLPNRTVSHWWRRHGHELVIEDLAEVLPELPERLLIGSGVDGRMHTDPDTLEQLAARGVAVEILRTPQAVRRYRELDPKRTAAALHLTC